MTARAPGVDKPTAFFIENFMALLFSALISATTKTHHINESLFHIHYAGLLSLRSIIVPVEAVQRI